jgi:hypothetical protein
MTRMVATLPRGRAHAASRPRRPLPRVRRIGLAVLGLQLIISLAWSTLLFDRFALTFDFTMFHQAWVLIAHGDLNPYNSIKKSFFWQDHSEFLVWPMALLYWVWPHSVVLLWLQDISVVLAEAVAFLWLCELAARWRPGAHAAWLAGVGLLLLVINPWTWWTLSWDFHSETTAMPFTVLLARDLCNNRRRAWVWIFPLLISGDVAATYIAALGLGALLAGRRWRVRGIILAAIGVGATLLITLVHGNLGSGQGLQAYGYLAGVGRHHGHLGLGSLVKGIVLHPGGVAAELWSKHRDIWATVAPSGLLGFGFIWLMPLSVIVVVANNLFVGWLFAAPGFQGLPLYILLPVGTVAVLAWLARRHQRIALPLAGLVVAQAVGWAAVWLPRTPGQWLRVSAPTAATLARVQAKIPYSAEVIASQGIMGRFAGRPDIQALFGPSALPVHGGQVWFVVTPRAGIETLSVANSDALVSELAGPLHATLIAHANGVWAFRWHPPAGVHTVKVPSGSTIPAWVEPGAAGHAVLAGPVPAWHVVATGRKGYVSDGLEWRRPAGRYQASVTLSSSGPVNVEVWNNNANVLLARRTVPGTGGTQSVTLPVSALTAYPPPSYSGWGPFRAIFLPPPPGQRLELRVWSPGGESVNVYSASLART